MVIKEETKSSWRDILPIVLLMYIPPIGAILMWLFSRWAAITKWIVTAIVIMQLAIVGFTSYNVYKFVRYQKSFSPVLGVQQALDIYGVQNGKYPAKLDELKPKYIEDLPADKSLQYTPSADAKTYILKATIEGKEVQLQPSLTQLPRMVTTVRSSRSREAVSMMASRK